MEDLASLGFRIDSSGLRRATTELDRMDGASGRADRSTRGLTSASDLLRNALTGVVAAIGVREIVQYSDEWRAVENQLKQVTRSTSELRSAQSNLLEIANETFSSFEATGNLFSRLSRSTTELGLSTSDLLKLTTTINKSFAASGATATEASAAITQLSQGFASGALRGDEFNSVSEQAPGIMRAIAESLNMTIGELRAFASEGGITAEIVVTALSGASEQIAADFDMMSRTFEQSLIVARNSLLQFVGENQTLSSTLEVVGNTIVDVSKKLTQVADAAAVVAIVIGGSLRGRWQ